MEKHEMTAGEYAYAQAKMCEHYKDGCRRCPLNHLKLMIGFTGNCAAYRKEFPHETVIAVQNWAEANLHPEKKPTMFVPDEIVRVTTIEMTQVVPKEWIGLYNNREFTENEIEALKDVLRMFLVTNYAPDDLHIKVQQFITKCHEEEI